MRFEKVNIEIGNICNLQCSFCPEVVRAKHLMDVDLFKNIIAQVKPYTDQVALHLMGEPLVHPELAEFVEICHAQGLRIFMVSNGILLRERQAELLLHPAFRQVNFSLHSFFDNFPDRDPGPYLERIFAYTERAFIERPDLYINYRLWNLEAPRGVGAKNQEMLARITARFGEQMGERDPESAPAPAINPRRDSRIHRGVRLRNRLYLHFDSEFTWPHPDLPWRTESGTCHALSKHFGILADGTVVPCCLDKEGVITLGRLNEQSLAQILEGPRAQAMRQGFQRGQLVEDLCQRCPYIERFKVRAPQRERQNSVRTTVGSV